MSRVLFITAAAVAVLLVIASTPQEVRGAGLLELTVGETIHRGRLETKNRSHCWLASRDGRLERIPLTGVTAFRKVDPTFKPLSPVEMRGRLQSEFGRGFQTGTSGRYIVCSADGNASVYAELFDDVYRRFRSYFGPRGFDLGEPEFPLVGVVLADRETFVKVALKEGVKVRSEIQGFYSTKTNRVLLYRREAGGMQPELRGLIIHEATHQIAYNLGLHSRIGSNPRWVVEGLATVFEAPGVWGGGRRADAKTRINRAFYFRYRNYAQTRRPEKSLVKFVAADDLYQKSIHDFYGQAWALSFYLLETRPAEYARYLKLIADRDPHESYTAEARVADFKSVFGDDVEWLEVELLRFMERME